MMPFYYCEACKTDHPEPPADFHTAQASKRQTLDRIVELIRTGRKREAIELRKEANFVLGDPELVEAYKRGSMLHILENSNN